MEEQNRVPRNLPVIHINNIVMFPFLMIPLVVSDETHKKVVDYALANDKLLGFFLSRGLDEEGEVDIYSFGCAVTILRMLRNQDGSISLLLQGVSRIKVEKIIQHHPFMMAEVETINENLDNNPKIQALKKVTLELLEKIVVESSEMNRELIFGLKSIKQNSRVADIIAGNLGIEVEEKQEILETFDLTRRYELLQKSLAELIKQSRLENMIRSNVQLTMDEDQRKYYLRGQMEAIKKELGESDEFSQEINNLKKKIIKANLPENILEAATEELQKLSMMSPGASEYSVIINYLDWIISLPWKKYSKDRLDLKKISSVLEKDHFGLEKAKERIMEFIAVKKLKHQLKGPILCFVGPPGVGKTSLGQSIARSMKRQFVRLSLGGIHDEAEIRGHRRTYIGAMPGKILNELKRCGTGNPVFMLDEIDKIGKDFRGDPSSALLEVLDPEQNTTFMDNYINQPFDLSEVMFITTANSLETVPPALRDRMEIIEFSSYIEDEKVQIAKDYLIPKEMENNGLTAKEIKMESTCVRELIRYYVREAGVRTLQRTIASIMRKVARRVAENAVDFKKVTVTSKNVKEFLGNHKYMLEMANREAEIGIVTGLAWTVYGGEILFCESSMMPGKGRLILTGRLGEVMQESAKIAMSYLKSNYKKYGIDIKDFDKYDIHIHLPSGSVPKDGPSAGVTLTTSLASLLTRRKVQYDIAMTGEITLPGKVLAIGGLREKVLAAKRAGIKKVIIPDENRDTWDDVPKSVKEGMEVFFVKRIEEVLNLVLLPAPPRPKPEKEKDKKKEAVETEENNQE